MNREQAVKYLSFSGFSDEQIKAIEGAFSCPSAGIDCEDCPAYEKKSEWQQDHEILKAYSDGASAVLDKIRNEVCDIDDEMVLNPDSFYERKVYVRFYKVIEIIDKYKAESGV